MLTRIQLKADGDTAHSVEQELQDAMRATLEALGEYANPKDAHQVIEGSPGRGFQGRLTFSLALVRAVA